MSDSRHDAKVAIVDPILRGIIALDAVHVPRRLRRTIRQNIYEVRVNSAFAAVVAACAAPGPQREDTWISYGIENLYSQLHMMGSAHSVECWQDGALVGGLYGVCLGSAFFGESMFSVKRDASKVALVHLCARLIKGGFSLLDTQFITSHLEQFGAQEILREDYQKILTAALKSNADFAALPQGKDGKATLEIINGAVK